MEDQFVEIRFKTMGSKWDIRSGLSRMFYKLASLISSDGCTAKTPAAAREWAIARNMGLESVKLCQSTREATVRFSRPGKPEDEGYDKAELARSLAAFAANPPILILTEQGKCVKSSHYGTD